MNTLSNFRNMVRNKKFSSYTTDLLNDYVQVNIFIIPDRYADSFRDYCNYNSHCCPLVYESKKGQTNLRKLGNIDIRSDVTKYQVFKYGDLVCEPLDIDDFWQDDLKTFVLGSTTSINNILLKEKVSIPSVERRVNPPTYLSNIPTQDIDCFSGNVLVSMRLIKPEQIKTVIKETKHFPYFYGVPVHIGSPSEIGIDDLSNPYSGEFVETNDDRIPVFWGCGATPIVAIRNAKLPLAICHKPGHMLITDLTDFELTRKIKNSYRPLEHIKI